VYVCMHVGSPLSVYVAYPLKVACRYVRVLLAGVASTSGVTAVRSPRQILPHPARGTRLYAVGAAGASSTVSCTPAAQHSAAAHPSTTAAPPLHSSPNWPSSPDWTTEDFIDMDAQVAAHTQNRGAPHARANLFSESAQTHPLVSTRVGGGTSLHAAGGVGASTTTTARFSGGIPPPHVHVTCLHMAGYM
jgi:hypothetical protein